MDRSGRGYRKNSGEHPRRYGNCRSYHLVQRFSACAALELSDRWKNSKPLMRITTMTFQAGGLEYLVETAEKGFPDWYRIGAWGGQTVFTFPRKRRFSTLISEIRRVVTSRGAAVLPQLPCLFQLVNPLLLLLNRYCREE